MSMCIIRAYRSIDNNFFTSPIFSHRAEWLNGWRPHSLQSRLSRDGGGLFVLPDHRRFRPR